MGARRILVFFIFFALVQRSTSSSCDAFAEPCFLHNNFEIPYIETRHPNIMFCPEMVAEKYCDLFALDPNIWYRSTYNMTTHVVKWQGCGTKYPIWLNGTIPGPTDGTVSRTACVRGMLGDEECELNYTVQIKNCNYYTVYCFPYVPKDCHQRYCFDIDRTAFTTTPTTPSTFARTTPAPRMSTASSTDCCKTSPDHSTQGRLSREEFCTLRKCLAVFLVTLCTCTAVFGVTMVTVLYLNRRKISPEAKYLSPTNKSDWFGTQVPKE